MGNVASAMSMSLDGFVTAPNDSREYPLGEGGWGDGGPAGDVPCFVLTHQPPADAPKVFTFVTDGIGSAVAQAKAVAGDRTVGIHGATAAQQALAAGLLDEIQVHLVPVLLGNGVRLFDLLGGAPVNLTRDRVVEAGSGVTHLRFEVIR